MEKMNFSIEINAPASRVWEVLWADDTYRQWTAPFNPGSYAESDWKEGSKILFLSPGGDGMVARIAAKQPNKLMSFEHYGMVHNGVEDTTSDAVKGWAGAHEDYHLSEKDGKTTVRVETDITDEYKEMFEGIWPKALQRLREIAEGS
ncbi:MAG TPA: SRPBCC domain-containing protein [Chitinophagaceae bacterium]|nr:SRPBCC domain-containing protein [Chitinophagaceae bacterium]